jgi:hypothetical protein
MQRLFPVYVIVVLCVSVMLFSCNEKETIAAITQQDILIQHKWKHYQTRTISIDTTTNTVVKDTMYLVEPCSQNSLYVFAADSVVKRTLQCFAPASNNEGRWYLKTDSTFAAPITVRTSYGTGWIYTDFGLPYGKMKLLTQSDFQLFAISYRGFGPVKFHNTLYLKAEN